MAGIFLSYRREDTAGHAGRLYDHLKRQFGKDGVFRDKERIQPGGDFSKILHHQLSGASLVIAIIGKRWAQSFSERACDPATCDWVLTELKIALDWKIPIIPLLVDQAAMPRDHELPEELRPLATLQAHSLEDSEQSITAFVRGLPAAVPTLPQKRSWKLRLGATLGRFRISIGASLIVGSIALLLLSHQQQGTAPSRPTVIIPPVAVPPGSSDPSNRESPEPPSQVPSSSPAPAPTAPAPSIPPSPEPMAPAKSTSRSPKPVSPPPSTPQSSEPTPGRSEPPSPAPSNQPAAPVWQASWERLPSRHTPSDNQPIGMFACPDGSGMWQVDIHIQRGYRCVKLPASPLTQTVLSRAERQVSGSHVCPQGYYLRGMDIEQNRFLCDANPEVILGHGVIAEPGDTFCDTGRVAVGFNAAQSMLICAAVTTRR